MRKTPTPRTLSDFLRELDERNQTVAAWAKERNFPLSVVYQVTRGRLVGKHGVSRDIVRAMGLPVPARFAPRDTAAESRAA